MTALANENGAVPAQDDADNALATSSVWDFLLVPPTDEQIAHRDAIASGEACCVQGCNEVPNEGHKHDMHNPFGLPAEEIARRDERHAARQRALPRFTHGLSLMTDEGEAEWWRRREVHHALRGPYWDHEFVLFPAFTDADLEYSLWRPWAGPATPASMDDLYPGDIEKIKRFRAILDALDSDHDERHWFYAHPFCRGCFPDELWADSRFSVVEPRLANWMLRNGTRGFPADGWDGVVPPMPHDEESLDLLTLDDLNAIPKPGWLIRDLLPANATGVLRARDQSFKSFMALDMALQVAGAGKRVLYCIGEGASRFGERIDAWLEHSGWDRDEVESLDLLPGVPNLFTGGQTYNKVLAWARNTGYDLIVIDTYARATAGSDINSQQDQSIVTTRVDELKRISNGTVLLVAHSQKSDTDSSGSIEIEDARDFVFAMKRSGNEVTFEVTKQKDGTESPKPMRYVAQPVGKSIVLVEAGLGNDEPLMTARDWIIAALENTSGLGSRTEAQIREWVNTNDQRARLGHKELTKSTSSSTLSRLVKDERVVKTGSRYSLHDAVPVAS